VSPLGGMIVPYYAADSALIASGGSGLHQTGPAVGGGFTEGLWECDSKAR
jgi:hypothetical protein